MHQFNQKLNFKKVVISYKNEDTIPDNLQVNSIYVICNSLKMITSKMCYQIGLNLYALWFIMPNVMVLIKQSSYVFLNHRSSNH